MKTIHYLFFGALLLGASCTGSQLDTEKIVREYNYIAGTQTIGAKYKFTEKPVLVESAERIEAMGSNILKIALYHHNPIDGGETEVSESFKGASPLKLVSEEPIIKAVLDMNFTYNLIWTSTPQVDWTDGMSNEESDREYQSIKELAEYFLTNYKGSGKKFFIGHWEGDWLLLGNYSRDQEKNDPVRIQGMIDWYHIRQKAIDDARNNISSDVEVFHYLELNRVNVAMRNNFDRIVNRVLPYVDVDYVSYSSYESTSEEVSGYDYKELKDYLFTSLDYIEKQMKPKESIKGKRVFLGEYGYNLPIVKDSPVDQAYCTLNTIQAGIEWGCPFILYWEMYDNEGSGFWMVDKNNVEQPVYKVHEAYYSAMKDFVRTFTIANKRAPNTDEFKEKAIECIINLRSNLTNTTK
jgi:hypothetical protein